MKNLCLDIGNVLCYVDLNPFVNLLSNNTKASVYECWKFLNNIQKKHDLGIIDFSFEIKNYFNINSSQVLDELMASWDNTISINNHLLDKLNKFIKDNNVNLALLSNIGFEHAKLIDNNFDIISDVKHFSCHVGARKPNLIYYQSFISQYPEYKNCLYIDDLHENLNMGKKIGLNALHFSLESEKQLISLHSSKEADIYVADKLINLISDNI